jgi:hypothetical protein
VQWTSRLAAARPTKKSVSGFNLNHSEAPTTPKATQNNQSAKLSFAQLTCLKNLCADSPDQKVDARREHAQAKSAKYQGTANMELFGAASSGA